MLFDVTTPTKKADILHLVPDIHQLQRDLAPALPDPDPDILENIRKMDAMKEEVRQAEKYERQKVPQIQDQDGIYTPESTKRLYERITLAKKQKLTNLWRQFGSARTASFYSSQTGIRLESCEVLIRRLRKGEKVATPAKKPGRKPKLIDIWANQVCRDALISFSKTTLREMEAGLADSEVPLSRSSISWMLTMKRDGIDFPLFSFKRLSVRGATGNSDENKTMRIHFVSQLATAIEHGRTILYIDESSWNRECIKKYGWSKEGDKAFTEAPSSFISYSALCSMSYDGIQHSEIIRGHIDSALFEAYIKRLLITLPEEVHCTFVMDNASIHKVSTAQYVEMSGHTVLFNAAYSPELNPIEMSFGIWKTRVEGEISRWEGEEAFLNTIKEKLLSISVYEVRKTIEHVRAHVWPKVAAREDL
jgi:transposase